MKCPTNSSPPGDVNSNLNPSLKDQPNTNTNQKLEHVGTNKQTKKA